MYIYYFGDTICSSCGFYWIKTKQKTDGLCHQSGAGWTSRREGAQRRPGRSCKLKHGTPVQLLVDRLSLLGFTKSGVNHAGRTRQRRLGWNSRSQWNQGDVSLSQHHHLLLHVQTQVLKYDPTPPNSGRIAIGRLEI